MKRKLFLPFILCSTLAIVSCGAGSSQKNSNTHEVASIPSYDADSAYRYVQAQTEFGPRVPGTKAHQACKNYMAQKMAQFGAKLSLQDCTVKMWDGSKLAATNIIASYFPEKTRRILLCAHWDSRPWADQDQDPTKHHDPVMGANDGGSGVGVLMEVARQLQMEALKANTPAYGVDIVFFDAEDVGTPTFAEETTQGDFWCLGTNYWAKEAKAKGYKAEFGILLDMVGGTSPSFMWETFSNQYASTYLQKVWNTAAKLGYSSMFVSAQGGSITDDHVPVNQIAGIPCIDIIDYSPSSPTGFVPYWHTTHDTMDKIDKNSLKAVGETLMSVLFPSL
jgi:hypothetical protein